MKTYTLYIATPCPYCLLVLHAIKEHGVDCIEVIDTHWDADMHQELMARYGKSQVPLLLIDETPLFESSDIIRYIETNLC